MTQHGSPNVLRFITHTEQNMEHLLSSGAKSVQKRQEKLQTMQAPLEVFSTQICRAGLVDMVRMLSWAGEENGHRVMQSRIGIVRFNTITFHMVVLILLLVILHK